MTTRPLQPPAASTAMAQSLPAPAAPLPSVPDYARWTREDQAAFLRALAATHSVSAAARSIGKSRQSAYELRARLRGQPFDFAWDAAFRFAFKALAEAAMDRAVNGVEVLHFHHGELVGTSRRFDERLTVALLAMRAQFMQGGAARGHSARRFEPGDFNGFLHRVENGPEEWQDEAAEYDGWDEG